MMEMAMEQGVGSTELQATMERLAAAASLLEHAVEQMGLNKPVAQLSAEAEASIERIVATAEAKREAELERKLEFVEAQLEALRASRAATVVEGGRRTLPTNMSTLLAKQGVAVESLEAGGLDAGQGGALDRALASLSIEQRIAVKAQLLRSGALR